MGASSEGGGGGGGSGPIELGKPCLSILITVLAVCVAFLFSFM